MHTGVEIKEMKDMEEVQSGNESLEIWTCGCTAVGSVTPINVRCVNCSSVFKKVGKKSKMSGQKKTKNETVKIELVNNIQTLYSGKEEIVPCERCNDREEIKVFTQEWDRIKSHQSPCPVCRSQEWLDWSAGRRLVGGM